jgi:DNA-binding response OmpR family regulator/two-component sensor histidine kinase
MSANAVILIVDDQLSNLAFLDMMLMEEGYDTELVRSGEHALLVAQNTAIDLILLDVAMPGWDGYETCRRLKSDTRLAKVPVLFLSALDDSESRIKAFDVGGVDYIHKPFQKAELLARVKNHIELYRLREHLEEQIATRDSQIKVYANTLERKVQERTAELFAAKEEAEAGNRAKSKFLATMSHELRTPMNAILGYSEMLHEEEEDIQKRADLEKIHAAASHLLGLINDVLDLSKVESGKMELHLEEFNFGEMLKQLLTTALPLIEKNNNHFELLIDSDPGTIYADLTKCRQIILNLISNAAKFTQNGKIHIHVQRKDNGEREWLSLRISDEGIGMTEDQLKKLFQPFTQADASTTRRYGGTGLGLAISKQFIDMMGGNISVHSVFGEGSSFNIHLPVRVYKQAQAPRREDLLAQVSGVVLLIHEDPSLREMIKSYLSRLGYSVALASSGREGVHLAEKLRPDAIIVDLILPDMDGWVVIAMLKANRLLAEIPVFMFNADPQHQASGLLAATDYLDKPAHEEQLAALMQKYNIGDKSNALIMVVDDDHIHRETVAETLKNEGWRVFQAENGRVALASLAHKQPNLILLDLHMPEMDGFEFIEQMRANAHWKNIPIVVMTAMKLTSNEYARLHRHVQDIKRKQNTNPSELLPQIHTLLSKALHTDKHDHKQTHTPLSSSTTLD